MGILSPPQANFGVSISRSIEENIEACGISGTEETEILKKYSEHWALDRMTVIDRNILRFGVCELLYFSSVPPKVAINEAVEVAKKYGNEESPDFINGVLDRIYKDLSPSLVHPSDQ